MANIPLFPPAQKVQLTFGLYQDELQMLHEMADEDGVSVEEMLRRAIRTERLLRDELVEELYIASQGGRLMRLMRRMNPFARQRVN